ncbi:secreted RxLR effector protein [Trifolium repens]|nr:secreted RxLR effector protein [Trifolium repens]
MSSNTSNNILRSILDKEKLNGSNFLDWHRNLRIVLKHDNKLYALEEPVPENEPANNAPRAEKDAYKKHVDDANEVACLMLATMNSELQKQHENMNAVEMIEHLKTLYAEQARHERFEVSKSLFQCKLSEGSPVGPHVLKMIGYVGNLERLGFPLEKELATDLILQSLPDSFNQFILNFNMNNLDKTLPELLSMLRTAEQNLKFKGKSILMVSNGNKHHKKPKKQGGKWKGKGVAKPKETPPALKPSGSISKEGNCFYCGKTGHWKRNCPKYLEDKKKGVAPTTSGIFVIEINLSTSTSWVLDTGCGSHICTNVQELKESRELAKGEVDLRVGNGARVAALAVGTYNLSLPSGLIIQLKNCYYVPAISRNIISVSCLDKFGFSFMIKNNCCSIYLNDIFYANAQMYNGLYVLDLETPVYNINTKRMKPNELNPSYLWHCRLGHINERRISKLHKDGLLDSFDYESYDTCRSCLIGKMTKAPFKGKGERANDLLALIHTDVCGPLNIPARGGFTYFITFTDDFSRYGYVYLMKHKSESFEKFREFKNEVQNQLGKNIKTLRSDRGGEYLSQEFNDHLKECGIVSQLTPPGTPQWNGVSERRNRTLLDMVRSMMSHADLPNSFWGHALLTAAYTLNHVPSKKVEKTPYEIWSGKKPHLSFMKVWGCEVYVKRLITTKLEPKSDKCLFVGYPKETRGYYFYNPSEGKVFVARTGVFLEREFISKGISGRNVELEEIQEPPIIGHTLEEHEQQPQDVVEEQPAQVEQIQRRSNRMRHEPERYGYLITEQGDVLLMDQDEPVTYQEAITGPESEKWLEAMKSEIDSMYTNQVWNLVGPPVGVRPIGCKWVFKKKTDMDGKVHTYKARLVAKGYKQIHGVDYDETFSPVAMLKSVRILLAIAAYHDYEIWQMDVKTAFLNGNLLEDVYMTQPEGFDIPNEAHKICKLQRSIYGLKQASRSWNLRFDETVTKYGFIKNEDEPCVYKKVSGSKIVFLVLYVDDILLIGNDVPALQQVKTWLGNCFSMKDLGEAAYILGIRIYRDRSQRLLGLSQSTYIDKVLRRFNMHDSKKGFIPMQHGICLSKTQCPSSKEERERMNEIPYASAIGSIMYAMLCTRPDVSYALSATSRYQSDPGESHWIAVKNILKYLRRTKETFLVYGGEEELSVVGYTDASFQTDKDDFRSQSGFVFCLNGGAVSWKSSKQETVADSTTEAEYIAASSAAKEAVWIKKFISELEVVPSIVDPISLYCDNSGAIAQAKEPRSHQRSKHILRRFHLIREIIDRGDVKICKVPTLDNIADPLTKPLAQLKHDGHTRSMGIKVMPDWL